jgi:NAD(P) transhydrogenase
MRSADLVVIGSGPAGQRGAIQAAKLGKRVVLIEAHPSPGGVTVNTGTVPSKTLREAALYLSGWRQRAFYGNGYRQQQSLCIEDLFRRLNTTVAHGVDVITDQLRRNGVTVIQGKASFLGPHQLLVENESGGQSEVQAEHVLIATGSRPYRPTSVPFDGRTIIDSDELLRIDRLPRTMTVIGAGVIGLEYATIFSAMDVRVTLIDGRKTMLDFVDQEIVRELEHHLRDRGVALRLGENVASIEALGDGKVVTRLQSGREVRSELVMFAAGRVGCTGSLRLENAGLAADDRGRIAVDGQMRTAQRHIFAAGDVVGFPALASTAMEQGRQAVCHAFGLSAAAVSSERFPFGIYAVPEIGMIGATEEDLRKQGVPYEVGVARLRETARGQISGLREGYLKMLVGLNDRKVLGVHILGEGATELIHIGQTAMAFGGTLDYFVETVFNYPTLAEAYKVAALDAWNRMPLRVRASSTERLKAV